MTREYAALAWALLAWAGVLLACWAGKPRTADRSYWPFVFRLAAVAGFAVGTLAFWVSAAYPWEIP